ncbi:MAG TPA: hypothetical protein DD405_01200 [Desulfobacteraceae bacterium]|nr:hypothetical protein [Desulfobacteraceae bacterium]
MIINKTGKIIDGLFMLGHPGVPVYLVDGDAPAIFDGGFSCLGELYVKEIRKVLGGREPEFCFLSHSHFDHCGAVSIFKKHFPGIKIVSSAKAKKVFERPNAIALIKQLNKASEPQVHDSMISQGKVNDFFQFEVDLTVKQDDVLKLSDNISVNVIETPGHTRDCLSYYIPEKKILISSEAFGVQDITGHIYTDFLVDYDIYYNSMEKMIPLETRVICTAHAFVFTEKDAVDYKFNALSACKTFLKLVEELLVKENGDTEKVKLRIKAMEYDGKPGFKQPEPAYLLNLAARINVVKKRMGEKMQ